MSRTLWIVGAVVLLGAHLWQLHTHWAITRGNAYGADFASYHYAVEVALSGGDPYDPAALAHAARFEKVRRVVHPFFYPPPFLLFVAWTSRLSLGQAYHLWFWLDEAFAVLAALLLWRWWRPLGPAVGPLVFAAVATCTAIANNHLMGQMNLPVLAAVIGGLWAEDRDRPLLGGALIGVACMLKMSPALFVLWWLLRGRWRPAVVACVTGLVLSVLALPMAPVAIQLRFYRDVLPTFSTGDYNGLLVPIALFGNHSLPDLFHRWSGGGEVLSAGARAASTLSAVVLVGGLGAWFRGHDAPLERAAQVAAIALLTLILPVYTYEHHLVWALPAIVVVGCAVAGGAAPRWWAVPLALAWLGWAAELSWLKALWSDVGPSSPLGVAVREVKFGALVVLLVLCARLGRGSLSRREGSDAG